jgi:hypothetical protein
LSAQGHPHKAGRLKKILSREKPHQPLNNADKLMRGIQMLHVVAIVVIVATIILVLIGVNPKEVEPPASQQAQQHYDNSQHLQVSIDSLTRVNAELQRLSSLYEDDIRSVDARYVQHHAVVRNAGADGLRHILDSLRAAYVINRERYRVLLDRRLTADY